MQTTHGEHAQRLYEVEEVVAMLKTGRTTLYQEMRVGRLRSVRIGTRRLFAAADIDAYVELLRSEAGSAE